MEATKIEINSSIMVSIYIPAGASPDQGPGFSGRVYGWSRWNGELMEGGREDDHGGCKHFMGSLCMVGGSVRIVYGVRVFGLVSI